MSLRRILETFLYFKSVYLSICLFISLCVYVWVGGFACTYMCGGQMTTRGSGFSPFKCGCWGFRIGGKQLSEMSPLTLAF